jgi:hypothetical protein
MYESWDPRGWCYHTVQIAACTTGILFLIGLALLV